MFMFCSLAASSLTCNVCDFRFVTCLSRGSTVDCTGSCFKTKAYLGSLPFFSKLGCQANCQSAVNKTDSVFSFQYDTTCCTTDLCNSGSPVKVSLSLGLGMALMWLLNAL
ncbi:hypothetical protein GDO81_003090 [Engystomops pustulosus]|uniref:UPAR/Ly6 domain-containing protein n=1 Tax=Engystomops pustulosus TaxID=76066 RepID=A0AAV6ZWE6_ENGPU|nr:hypothetical protein GDO81_003090 [Engystomops pustulosus]